jgi:hypothetical protein
MSYAGKQKKRAEQVHFHKSRVGRGDPKTAALSAVLAAAPASFDGRKIAVVDKNITALDALPERYAGAKVCPSARPPPRSRCFSLACPRRRQPCPPPGPSARTRFLPSLPTHPPTPPASLP